ncbi:rRNA processing/ribosome biogenesis-domain-containing protein [Corynascus similis CBS 632.67]
MAAPPDLRVLCRRLTSAPADDLPRLCPLLVSHVLRCGDPLSAPSDTKVKDRSAETPVLVHKLRTHITTLLTGKSSSGRFAAACLIKAIIDVGGWESLRASGPWIRGLIGVLQKPDPLASKELCIVTLTKIYVLLQGYQTLIREMATPTLPDYVSACLRLISPPASGTQLKVPATFVDTVACSLSKLVVLYPTTLRPFAAQMKAALRVYIAPTPSDAFYPVPQGLRESARRLFILLSYTAPKNGSSEEWAKAIRSTILDSHATVGQIFRGVVESWESTTGYRGEAVGTGPDPSGGSDTADGLPCWVGVHAGAQRLIGLLDFLAEYFNNPTKAPVSIPLGELLDLTTRITLVTPPTGTEDSIETNPAIGRDEKAELWSVLPDIHMAVLRLHHGLIRRLRENAVPLATDILDQAVRVTTASRHIPAIRETAYLLTSQLLHLSGPTLPKLTVESLSSLLQSTCRDILLSTGHLESTSPPQSTNPNIAKPTNQQQQQPHKQNTSSTNADAYLGTLANNPASSLPPPLAPSHLAAAEALLPVMLTHLPQTALAPDLRGLLDRTAVLSHACDAMLASCLHPYRDSRGRYYPSILPFLVRRFPRELGVEVLRSNLVRGGASGVGGGDGGIAGSNAGGVMVEQGLEELLMGKKERGAGEDEAGMDGEEPVVDDGQQDGGESGEGKGRGRDKTLGGIGGWGGDAMDVDDSSARATSESVNPFAVVTTAAAAEEKREVPVRPASPLKRKSEVFEADAGKPPKRLDTGKAVAPQVAVVPQAKTTEEKEESGDDSDSEGSVQIDMTLEDDEEDDEEEEDE